MRQLIELALQMLSPAFDWVDYWGRGGEYKSAEDAFRACCKTSGLLPQEQWPDLVPCGHLAYADTPFALFRLLILLRHVQVHCSSMERASLFAFCSADERFWVCAYLVRGALRLNFFCRSESLRCADTGERSTLPGDSGFIVLDEDGPVFFELVARAVGAEEVEVMESQVAEGAPADRPGFSQVIAQLAARSLFALSMGLDDASFAWFAAGVACGAAGLLRDGIPEREVTRLLDTCCSAAYALEEEVAPVRSELAE